MAEPANRKTKKSVKSVLNPLNPLVIASFISYATFSTSYFVAVSKYTHTELTAQEIDTVIVAGNMFDTATPPSSALEMYRCQMCSLPEE